MTALPAAKTSKLPSDEAGKIPCHLCMSRHFEWKLHVSEAFFSSRIKEFDVYQCRCCGLSTMRPFPDQKDVEEIYVDERIFSRPIPNVNGSRWFARFLEPLYQAHGSYYPFIAKSCLQLTRDGSRDQSTSVLDIGCSTGRLLSEFGRRCPASNLTGIDIDPDVRVAAIPEVRGCLVLGDFLTHDFQDCFDIITLCFVIEHLLDIHAYISRAVKLLRPGGILFVSTPDIDSPKARQLRDRWRLLNDPTFKTGHVNWFNRRALAHLAEMYGLRLERCCHRGEFLHHLPPLVQRFLRGMLGTTPSPWGERFIKNYQLRMVYAILFDGLLAPRFDWGDCLYAFLRKPVKQIEQTCSSLAA